MDNHLIHNFFKQDFMYLPCPNWAHYWKWADTQYPPFVGNPFFWKMPLTLGAIPYTRFEPHPHNKPWLNQQHPTLVQLMRHGGYKGWIRYENQGVYLKCGQILYL